jgi:hypothetical protein
MGSQSGNLVEGDDSMGAGVTSHADDQFNQLSKAPTPAPKVGEAAFKALHYDTTATVAVPTKWEITSGNDCTLFTDADGHCVTDNGSTQGGLKCSKNGRWYRYNSYPAGASTTTRCWGGSWQAKSFKSSEYGNNHKCSFKYTGDATLTVQEFQIETWWDWMKVNGRYFDSSYPLPSSFAVSGTTNFEFSSDFVVTKEGFKICEPESTTEVTTSTAEEVGNTDQIDEQDALDNMPTAQPTAFPTKIQADRDAIGETHDINWGWTIQTKTREEGPCVQKRCRWWGCYCAQYAPVPRNSVCQATVEDNANTVCITDGTDNYRADEVCEFTFTGPGVLQAREFNTERNYDFMQIGATTYHGQTTSMNNLALSGDTKFKFTSDYMVQREGFKFCVAKPESKGSICKSTVAWADGSTTKPVGWVGAGPGADYCNVWKCEVGQTEFTEQDFTGTFRKQQKTCSVEEHGTKFCSHTSCTFEGSPRVIKVHSDHREEVGGFHQCGFNQHSAGQASRVRPACDCVCKGKRRQDKKGFARGLNAIASFIKTKKNRRVGDNFDATKSKAGFDRQFNSNNFYSQHDNIDRTDLQNNLANVNGNSEGRFAVDTTMATQYNQKDQKYNGERVAHFHQDS